MPVKKSPELTLRPVKIEINPLDYAEGSALISVGRTRVLCAATVEPGRPKWMEKQKDQRGWITAEYSLLPRSTKTRTRRERGTVSGRTQEIQRLIGRSLRAVAELAAIGNHTITVDCDVLQADGGTRTASITGGYVALYEACRKMQHENLVSAFPINDQVAAVSVGYFQNELVLDLDYERDSAADVDMNVVMTGAGKLIEVQGTAEGKPFTKAQLAKMIALAEQGIRGLFAVQKKVLRI
ncbi:MAG TPA: ribonuclease PH [bacterium]|nr:ribonuclease PH [bacterium]